MNETPLPQRECVRVCVWLLHSDDGSNRFRSSRFLHAEPGRDKRLVLVWQEDSGGGSHESNIVCEAFFCAGHLGRSPPPTPAPSPLTLDVLLLLLLTALNVKSLSQPSPDPVHISAISGNGEKLDSAF